MAKRKTKAPVTDAQLQADATAAHEQQLAANPVDQPLPDPDAVPLYPSTPPELLDAPAQPAEAFTSHATLPPEEAKAIHEEVSHALRHQKRAHPTDPLAIFKDRDWNKFSDPAPIHGVHFDDGYVIRAQQSDSRHTIEIQFGDGSKAAQPKAFDKIKQALLAAGMNWNARPGVPGNAWEIELRDEKYGTHAERHAAKQANKAIRTRIEEQVLPQVIGLEEAVRGPVDLTEGYRERIAKGVNGR